MKILPNLLTVDSDRANFPLHGGIKDFFVQSNEPKGALKKHRVKCLVGVPSKAASSRREEK